MGMSTHVVGFRAADEQWRKMKAAWDACLEAGVGVPRDVSAFFEHEYPDDKPGMEIDINTAVSDFVSDSRGGYDVDITKLPDGVKIVRFYNSW